MQGKQQFIAKTLAYVGFSLYLCTLTGDTVPAPEAETAEEAGAKVPIFNHLIYIFN